MGTKTWRRGCRNFNQGGKVMKKYILYFLFILIIVVFISENSLANQKAPASTDLINETIQHIHITKISATENKFTDINNKKLGVEYQLFFEIPNRYVTDHLGEQLGFQLNFPNEIYQILGYNKSGITYGFSLIEKKKGSNLYMVQYAFAGDSITKDDINKLIQYKDKITVNLYFNDSLYQSV